MGGLQRLFLRITPIIMLICFICFGITHIFDRNETRHLTYLTHETINAGTTENPIYIENYQFDTVSYIDNLDVNILERATTNAIDLATFKTTLSSFNAIWENGYQAGDISKTILNACILVVNSILTIINIVITPLRICAGIILTGLSIVGINISVNTPILTALNTILDFSAIPLIQPVTDNTQSNLYDTYWELNAPVQGYTWTYQLNFEVIDLTNNRTYTCDQIRVEYFSANNNIIQYRFADNQQLFTAYRNGQWLYGQDYKIIWITDNTLNNSEEYNIQNMLQLIATEYTPPQ